MHYSKYKAKKTVVDGIKFDSKAEADYYLELIQQEKVGLLDILELQPKVYLTKTKILYKPDFLIYQNKTKIYIDVKGVETPVFKIKKRLWKDYGAGCLRLVKRSGKKFKVTEEIYSN